MYLGVVAEMGRDDEGLIRSCFRSYADLKPPHCFNVQYTLTALTPHGRISRALPPIREYNISLTGVNLHRDHDLRNFAKNPLSADYQSNLIIHPASNHF